MAITEGQAQIGNLVLGLGTSYHMLRTDFFSWPANRSKRTPAPTISGYDFDPIDLFTGKTVSLDMMIKDADLLGAMRTLSAACTTTMADEFITLDMFLPHDDGPKRMLGRVKDLAFPSFDRKTFSKATECVLTFDGELPYLTGITENSSTNSLLVSSGGHTFNHTFPLTFGASGSGGGFQVVNAGNTPSYPTFRINGPTTNPKIINQDQDVFLEFMITLSASDYLLIDVRNSEVKLNGTASRYNTLTNDSDWFMLNQGTNNLFYSSDAYDAAATLVTTWYDAYRV